MNSDNEKDARTNDGPTDKQPPPPDDVELDIADFGMELEPSTPSTPSQE